MKTLLLVAGLLLAGGDAEKGLLLYREGRFAEAAAAFRAAIASEGDSAELQYNLALACWRAGDLAAAETAIEKYAASAADARVDLHRGLLGAVRYDEAKALEARADAAASSPPPIAAPGVTPPAAATPADPLPMLEQALGKANQAKDHFVAGAARGATPELLRNAERTLRYIDELQQKIDELRKQREEQQKKDDQQKPSDDAKDDQKKDGAEQPDQKEPPQQDEPKPDENGGKQKDQQQGENDQPSQGGEQKPEPKQDVKDGQEKQEPKPGDQQQPRTDEPEPKPAAPRTDAPGEHAEAKELSPEQTQRLQEQLKDLDKKLQALRARARSGRPPVERDW